MPYNWLQNHSAFSVTDQYLSSGAALFFGHVANARLVSKLRVMLFTVMLPLNFDIKIPPTNLIPVFTPNAVTTQNLIASASTEQYTSHHCTFFAAENHSLPLSVFVERTSGQLQGNFRAERSSVSRNKCYISHNTCLAILLSSSWTLILLTWRIWWAPNNASRWQMGCNSAFKWLSCKLLALVHICIHWPLTPFQCRDQERVELYLYATFGQYGLYRTSVPVQGCALPTSHICIYQSEFI